MHLQNLVKIVVLLFCLQSCGQKNTTVENIEFSKIAQENQINYIVDLTLKTPYELYINDIKISSNYSRGTNAAIEVNPYVLKNGKYKIKLKLFPFWQYNETFINKDELTNTRLFFGNYIKNRLTDEVTSYKADVPLTLNLPNEPISYFEQEWEVDITNLPYELEGWSNGQDLSRLDQNELEKKVIKFHKKIREILNQGNDKEWTKLTELRSREISIVNYNSNESEKKNIEQNQIDVKKYCTNMMIPLEDYEIKIYADGKLVTLERKTNTNEFNNKSHLNLKGWSPLIRKGQKSGGADYRILLYLPQDSDEFVIIRK